MFFGMYIKLTHQPVILAIDYSCQCSMISCCTFLFYLGYKVGKTFHGIQVIDTLFLSLKVLQDVMIL
jgi:hypothetical protein